VQNVIFQIITTFCLLLGVVSGEAISNKLFGISKKWYLNIIEIFLFISLLVLLFNNFFITELSTVIVFILNFFFGIIAITTTRTIISGAGFFTKKIKQKYALSKEINEEIIIIGLIRNLLPKGINKDGIKNILENSGFNKGKVKRTIKRIKLDEEEVVGTKKN